jgi:16S rRNA (uracil1498-N3)-methyltransferase
MSEPIFFYEGEFTTSAVVVLSEVTAKHIVQVLRMKEGDNLRLANGNGAEIKSTIVAAGKKSCEVKILEIIQHKAPAYKNCIAISTLKNHSRLEWFLEKATELGIDEIILLNCVRTERAIYKEERWRNILIAAMLQSQQYHLPKLVAPTDFNSLDLAHYPYKFIAHCEADDSKLPLSGFKKDQPGNTIVAIGPEGDFTMQEINYAKDKGLGAVSLGSTRLRTETAGLYAAFYLSTNNFI